MQVVGRVEPVLFEADMLYRREQPAVEWPVFREWWRALPEAQRVPLRHEGLLRRLRKAW